MGKGLSVDTESLTTLAQGGISFLTINNGGEPVAAGHVFKLYEKAEDEWLAAANQVAATNIELGGVTTLVKTWRQKGLLGRRSRDLAFNGVPLTQSDGQKVLIVPTLAMEIPEKAIDDRADFLLLTRTGGRKLEQQELVARGIEAVEGLSRLPMNGADDLDWLSMPNDFRQPDSKESVFAVRATMEDNKLAFLHYFIAESDLRDDWSLASFDGDEQLWHGSPVLAESDGKVVGVLLVARRNTRIVPFSPAFE